MRVWLQAVGRRYLARADDVRRAHAQLADFFESISGLTDRKVPAAFFGA